MSRPIVVTACMAQSSESGHPVGDHGPWHLRAGGGAVHSIISGSGSLDHLVGADQEGGRYREPERFRGFEIDDQVVRRWVLHG